MSKWDARTTSKVVLPWVITRSFTARRSKHAIIGALCQLRAKFDRKAGAGIVGVGWLVGRSTSQRYAGVSQGRVCSDNSTCCHTEKQVADQTFYLTRSGDTATR